MHQDGFALPEVIEQRFESDEPGEAGLLIGLAQELVMNEPVAQLDDAQVSMLQLVELAGFQLQAVLFLSLHSYPNRRICSLFVALQFCKHFVTRRGLVRSRRLNRRKRRGGSYFPASPFRGWMPPSAARQPRGTDHRYASLAILSTLEQLFIHEAQNLL